MSEESLSDVVDRTELTTYLLSRAIAHRDMANVAMRTGDLQKVISCAGFVTEDISLAAFLLGTDEIEDILTIAGALEPEEKKLITPDELPH
jgi:hypothetical protein